MLIGILFPFYCSGLIRLSRCGCALIEYWIINPKAKSPEQLIEFYFISIVCPITIPVAEIFFWQAGMHNNVSCAT